MGFFDQFRDPIILVGRRLLQKTSSYLIFADVNENEIHMWIGLFQMSVLKTANATHKQMSKQFEGNSFILIESLYQQLEGILQIIVLV